MVITDQLCWRTTNRLSLHGSPLGKNNAAALLAPEFREAVKAIAKKYEPVLKRLAEKKIHFLRKK